MAAPQTTVPHQERERWDVSRFNRKGMAHWWVDSPKDLEYVRSRCGQVESKSNLQGLAHELCRCDRCNRGLVGAGLAQMKKDVAKIRKMRALNICDREIADALGIAEDSPLLAQ